jgi:hypothetical protein
MYTDSMKGFSMDVEKYRGLDRPLSDILQLFTVTKFNHIFSG